MISLGNDLLEVSKHDREDWHAINGLVLLVRKHYQFLVLEHLLQLLVSHFQRHLCEVRHFDVHHLLEDSSLVFWSG